MDNSIVPRPHVTPQHENLLRALYDHLPDAFGPLWPWGTPIEKLDVADEDIEVMEARGLAIRQNIWHGYPLTKCARTHRLDLFRGPVTHITLTRKGALAARAVRR